MSSDAIASKTLDDSTLYSLQNKIIKQPTYTKTHTQLATSYLLIDNETIHSELTLCKRQLCN